MSLPAPPGPLNRVLSPTKHRQRVSSSIAPHALGHESGMIGFRAACRRAKTKPTRTPHLSRIKGAPHQVA